MRRFGFFRLCVWWMAFWCVGFPVMCLLLLANQALAVIDGRFFLDATISAFVASWKPFDAWAGISRE
jgi:endonuclease/exonuclease/phosphatase (EEP) superfamily protein YafD